MAASDNPDREVLGRQLAACQGILDFVADLVEHWDRYGGRELGYDADVIIASLFSRSTRTYEAVVKHLGNKGFGEQGLMLDRSLFEDMIDAHWVSINREIAIERFGAHDRWSRHLAAGVIESFPDYSTGEPIPTVDLTEEEKAQYKAWFGERGQHSWTGEGLHRRAKAVRECWKSEHGRRQFDFVYRRIHRMHNEILHVSSFSLGRLPTAPQEDEDGTVHFRFGSSSVMVTQALFSAFWSYSSMLGLLFETFDLNVGDLFNEKHYRLVAREMFPISAAQLAGVGRNDPCPCESGLKYKKCHGY